MDDETLLHLFGGNLESLKHFKLLRKLHKETRCNNDNICEEGSIVSEEMNVTCVTEDEVEPSHKSSNMHSAVLRPMDDVLYLDGEIFGYQTKQTALDLEDKKEEDFAIDKDSMDTEDSRLFECGQQGCTKKFSSLATYESHYHSCHHFVCATCRRVFVSSFMLDVHIQENHDSYFQILSSRIDMYQCLLESCGLKFRTQDLRKDHLVNIHKYPSNFSFHKPISEKRCEILPNNLRTEKEFQLVDKTSEAGKTETKTKKIPPSVCFGRGQQRSFQRRPRQKKRLNVEKPMDDN